MRWLVYVTSILVSALTALPAIALVANVFHEDNIWRPALLLMLFAGAYPFVAVFVAARAFYENYSNRPLSDRFFWVGAAAGGAVALFFIERSINDRGDAFLWVPIAMGGILLVCSALLGRTFSIRPEA